VARGLAFLVLVGGVVASLWGRRGFTARALYSGKCQARTVHAERASPPRCASRLPRLGGLVQNDSVYGLNNVTWNKMFKMPFGTEQLWSPARAR
jgi:hypothetical protein